MSLGPTTLLRVRMVSRSSGLSVGFLFILLLFIQGNYGKSLVGPTLDDGEERSSIGAHRYDDEGKDILLNTTIITGAPRYDDEGNDILLNTTIITGSRSRRSLGAAWNDHMKKALVSVTGMVPPVGGVPVGSLISLLLNIFWPDSQPNVWSLIKDQVEGLIDQKILEYELQERRSEMEALQTTMQSYVKARIREKGSLISTLIHKCNELFKHLTNSKNSVQLIPLVVTHSTQHLLILKERLLYGKDMYNEDNTAVWREELEVQISSYKKYIEDIYSKWVTWRKSQIIVHRIADILTVPYPVFQVPVKQYGEVYDQMSKDRVSYGSLGYTYENNPNYTPICEAVKKKWFSLRNAEMLQILVPTFYLDNFIPGNEDNPSVIPSAMSRASFGPISPHLDGGIKKPVLYTPDNDNKGGGDVTRISVREHNMIESFQVFYSTGAGLIYGSRFRKPNDDNKLCNRRVKYIQLCYNTCSQAALDILYNNGEGLRRLGTYDIQPLTCVKTGGIDTYGLYDIRAHDNRYIRGGDCAQGLFQIELDYKAYPVRPSEIPNRQLYFVGIAQNRDKNKNDRDIKKNDRDIYYWVSLTYHFLAAFRL